MAKRAIQKTITLGEFTTVNTNVVAGTFLPAFEYKVPAQLAMTWGYGDAGKQTGGADLRAKGYLTFKDSTGAVIDGLVRLMLYDANGYNKVMAKELRTEDLANGFEIEVFRDDDGNIVAVGQDSKLVIEFKPDNNATIDPAQSSARLPVSIFALQMRA